MNPRDKITRALANQLDPLTPVQMETSRRILAGNGLGGAIVNMTGLPMLNQGYNDVSAGYRDGNPMQMARGVGQSALAAAPWLAAGRAAMSAAPVTTTGAYAAVPNLDVSVPSANAAGAVMPPVPVSRQAAMMPTPASAAATPGPDPEQSTGATFWGQLKNNVSHVSDYVTGIYDEMTRSNEFVKPSFEDWAQQNAAEKLRAIGAAEEASRSDVKGVRDGGAIRNREAARAASLRAEVDQDYKSAVAELKAQHDARGDKRFAERNPKTAMAMKLAPILIAGGRYGRARKAHTRDVREMTGKVNAMPAGSAKAVAQDDLLALTQRQPSIAWHGAGGLAGSGLGKGIEDVTDATTLAPESKARQAVIDQFTTPEGAVKFGGELAARTAMAGAGVAAGGYFLGKGLSPRQRQEALTASGLPNAAAARTRQRIASELADVKRDRLETDALSDMTAAAVAGHRSRALKDMGVRARDAKGKFVNAETSRPALPKPTMESRQSSQSSGSVQSTTAHQSGPSRSQNSQHSIPLSSKDDKVRSAEIPQDARRSQSGQSQKAAPASSVAKKFDQSSGKRLRSQEDQDLIKNHIYRAWEKKGGGSITFEDLNLPDRITSKYSADTIKSYTAEIMRKAAAAGKAKGRDQVEELKRLRSAGFKFGAAGAAGIGAATAVGAPDQAEARERNRRKIARSLALGQRARRAYRQ